MVFGKLFKIFEILFEGFMERVWIVYSLFEVYLIYFEKNQELLVKESRAGLVLIRV